MALEPVQKIDSGSDSEYEKLRTLLVGPEQNRLSVITEELRTKAVRPEDLAEKLPEAIALRSSRDDQLGRALSPTIDTALRESIRRDPSEIATAIFPILGPAIRKAIAEAMAGLVRSINSAVDQSLSIQGMKWRIEAWRSGVPYPEVVLKHALVYRVEQAFLIHAETGLLLEHVSAADLEVTEADLISGMLSAIQDFVRDSFKQGDGAMLRTFSVGDHTVQVEAGPRALLALVIRGQAPDSLLERQQDTLETIHLEFAAQLADFNGDAAPFRRTRPLLEDCLETVLSTSQSKERSRFAWLRWGLPLILLLIVLGTLFVRSRMNWNRGLDALRAEPGLVVVDASRGLTRWNISGLRDPIARDAGMVLKSAGVDPGTLDGKWRGYLSLDPAIVTARTRQSRDSLRRLLEEDRILFDAGSAALSPRATQMLSEAGTRVHELDQLALASGQSVTLGLAGRTDLSGADKTNATLAQDRIQRVAGFLQLMGIDSSRIVPDPVATRAPLAAASPDETARINRSVTFNVRFSTASSAGGGQR